MNRKEEGMTILEVVIAITVLLIGASFLVQSNTLTYRYLGQQKLRQQMVFFASGRMEAALEGKTTFLSGTLASPFDKFTTTYSDVNTDPDFPVPIPHFDNDLSKPLMPLIPFKVTISAPGLSDVEMYNYRINLP